MGSSEPPFQSEYVTGSQTDSKTKEVKSLLAQAEGASTGAQTVAEDTTDTLPPVNQLIQAERYGIGKPKRIVIRGRISRE